VKLKEVVELKPDERERIGIPSYISSILPKAQSLLFDNEPPVEVYKKKWEVVVEDGINKLIRAFSFDDPRIKASFLLEVIDYEEQVGHHPHIEIMEDVIKISLWTKGIEDVTEIDIEFAEEVNMIAADVLYQFGVKRA
jgi:pterin-4a-carbinolamine dehydratase